MTLKINLKNTVNVGAFSFKIDLPEILTFTETKSSKIFSKTDRISSTIVETAKRLSDNQASFVAYDKDGVEGDGISEGDEAIYTFSVKVADDAKIGTYSIKIHDITASDLSGEKNYDSFATTKDATINIPEKIIYYTFTLTQSEGGTVSATPVAADNIYANGTALTLQATPDEGYEFVTWSNGITENPYTYNVSADATLSAQFAKKTFTVRYYANEELIHEQEVVYGEIIPYYSPSIEGYIFNGWMGNDYYYMPAKDVTITAVVTKIVENSVVVEAENGTVSIYPESENGIYMTGDIITITAIPDEGYSFARWSDGTVDNPYYTGVYGDINLTALFEINSYKVSYMDGDNCLSEYVVSYGGSLPDFTAPEKEGYTFKRWEGEVFETMPAKDITFTAIYEVNSYKVSYYDGETLLHEDVVVFGEAIPEYKAADKEAFTFVGWKGDKYETMPAKDITYTAVYGANTYKVSYYDGKVLIHEDFVDFGAAIPEFTPAEKTGYTFSGWQGDKYESMPSSDITYTAMYEVNSYTVSYYDGDELVHQVTVAYGETIPEYSYEKEGYNFMGWEGEKSYTTMPACDIKYTAVLEKPDAIEVLITSGVPVNVYTVQGACVKRNATAGELRSLPSGLYIINSKKMLIK